MTVESSTSRVSYTGSGTTGPFAVPFYFLENDDLKVIKTTNATGAEEVLTLTTDYTVTGAADPDGGSVTLVSPISSAYSLVIVRDPDRLQATAYPRNDPFPAASHERALDKLTMLVQRMRDLFDRSFRLSDGDVSGVDLEITESATARANKYLGFDSSGNLTLSQSLDVGSVVISAYMETVLDDTTAPAARTTLGAASLAANTFTGIQRWAKGADVASASALTLGTDGNYFDITGTTTITSIGTLGVGTWVKLHFDGALTLTHHATDLILPGEANITTAAGDEAEFVEYATGDWRCTNYVPAAFVPSIVAQATAEAGADTVPRLWTAERVAQAIAALGVSGFTVRTPVTMATSSPTEIGFTSIPAGVSMVIVGFKGASTNGTSGQIIQLGHSGGYVVTGYEGTVETGTSRAAHNTGFLLSTSTAASMAHRGHLILVRMDAAGTEWSMHGNLSLDAGANGVYSNSGSVTLAGALDRIRWTTVGGTDVADGGTMNISYI